MCFEGWGEKGEREGEKSGRNESREVGEKKELMLSSLHMHFMRFQSNQTQWMSNGRSPKSGYGGIS